MEGISEKERGIFNDSIIIVLLVFAYMVYHMLNTVGYRHDFVVKAIPIFIVVIVTFGLNLFLSTPIIKKVIFALTFCGFLYLFYPNPLNVFVLISLYSLFYFFQKTYKRDYGILIFMLFMLFVFYDKVGDIISLKNKFILLFVDAAIVLTLGFFLKKSIIKKTAFTLSFFILVFFFIKVNNWM